MARIRELPAGQHAAALAEQRMLVGELRVSLAKMKQTSMELANRISVSQTSVMDCRRKLQDAHRRARLPDENPPAASPEVTATRG